MCTAAPVPAPRRNPGILAHIMATETLIVPFELITLPYVMHGWVFFRTYGKWAAERRHGQQWWVQVEDTQADLIDALAKATKDPFWTQQP
jgi:hypothetical protein